MILATITSSSVKKHDLLISLAGLLVKDLAFAPHRRRDIDVAANDAVLVQLVLLVFWRRTGEGVVQKLQDSTPHVSPACKSILGSWSVAVVHKLDERLLQRT